MIHSIVDECFPLHADRLRTSAIDPDAAINITIVLRLFSEIHLIRNSEDDKDEYMVKMGRGGSDDEKDRCAMCEQRMLSNPCSSKGWKKYATLA